MSYQYKGANPQKVTTKRTEWGGRGRGCGTPAGYAAHIRDNTEKCEPCRQAHADYRHALRNKRKATA